MMGAMVCVIGALLVANAAQAQTHPATTVPARTQALQSAPAPQAKGPDALFARWDTNHDKLLSPAEFTTGWQRLQVAMASRRLHEQFAALDTDKNGSLDAAEYANLELIKHAGASAPPMSAFDTDKNQRLDFREYVNAVNHLLKQKHK